MTMILAGDIGGTKTVLALFQDEGGQLREVASDTFPSQAHSTFDGILREFLSRPKIDSVESGVFGVAGAVIDNLRWSSAFRLSPTG